jgi:type II secretory pathway component PulF
VVYNNHLWQPLKHACFTVRHQQAFLEDAANLIDDGISANQAIEMVSQIATGLTLQMVDDLLLAISEGRQFADGMDGWFAPHIIEMVRAGERAGTLTRAMHAAARSLAYKSDALKSLINSLAYPMLVVSLAVGVCIYVNNSILTDFKRFLPLERWPDSARFLVHFATFMQTWWWAVLCACFAVILLVASFLHYYVGNLRQAIDKLPGLSLYKQIVAARFLETLGMMLANGLVFKHALSILQDRASPYLSAHLLLMEYRLSYGKDNIGEVIDTGLIHPSDVTRLQVVAKSKSFEKSLTRIGQFSADMALEKIRRLGRVGGILLLFAGAALAGLIVFSVYGVGAVLGSSY